jgi:hypothetical protein
MILACWYQQGSSGAAAIFHTQGSVANFHALALEKESQVSDDDRQDGDADFLSNEKIRTEEGTKPFPPIQFEAM